MTIQNCMERKNSLRVVFMGTPDFSVPALSEIAKKHEVAAVVTQQDRPKGRGHQLQFPPVKEKALELGIPVYQPEKVKNPEFIEVLRSLEPEVIVVIAFGQMLPLEILNLPAYGCINVHASLLPKYRGAAPIQWAVINGESKTGVTTMYMAEEMDTGDIIDRAEVCVDADETGGSLFDKLSDVGAALILETLEKLESGVAPRTPQNNDEATYAGKITKELGKIDFSQPADVIERLIRGLNPWPSAYTKTDGKTLKIWKAEALAQKTQMAPGSILKKGKSGIWVATGDGVLNILELQLEGKKRMEVQAFLNGYNLTAEKFGE